MIFGGYRISLVDRAKDFWRWSSIRLMLVSGAIQTALLAFPVTLAQYVSPWLLTAMADASVVLLVLAGIGRICIVEKPNEPEPPKPPV